MPEGRILVVDPNLPIPPGTTSNDPTNPKSTVKKLMMTGAQATEDAQHDPPPQREGFRSQYDYSILYILLAGILLFFVCKKHPRYGCVLFGSVVLLIYLERNLNRTV